MTQPLHVLLVSSSLNFGGSDTYAVQLAHSLLERGDRVTVAFGRHYANPLLERLDPRVGRLELPFRSTEGSSLNHIPNLLGSTPVLARFCVAERVSVVHTVLPAVGLPAWAAARLTGRPAVHTPMCVADVASPLSRRVYRSRLTRALLSRYLVLCDYVTYDLAKHFGVPASDVRVSRLGVDVDRFQPRHAAEARPVVPAVSAARWVGVCGRLEPDKDIERAIRAFVLVDRSLGAHLAVVGDGTQREALEALARQLGIDDRVHFLGSRADVSAVMRQFDVGLQTTKGPLMGMVVIEMFASGVPVVIAARDDEEMRMAEDTLLGEGGGLVCHAAPEAIAAALERILGGSEAEREDYRARARATAEIHYDWTHHVDGVRRVYREVIDAAGAKRSGAVEAASAQAPAP